MHSTQPAAFKWSHFHGGVILQGVRGYWNYGISYRDFEDMQTRVSLNGSLIRLKDFTLGKYAAIKGFEIMRMFRLIRGANG